MPTALAKAEADLPAMRKALSDAEAELIGAKAEVDRLARKSADLNRRAIELGNQAKRFKSEAMESEAMDKPIEAKKAWTEFGSVRVAYQRCCDTLSWLNSWTQEEANLRLLRAELAERVAAANLLDGKAALMRVQMLSALGPAALSDPGMALDLSKSQSQQLLAKAVEIRRWAIPRAEEEVKKHEARVRKEREDVSLELFRIVA